jgi:exosortase/archaeosortase
MTAQLLSAIAGVVLSLAFSYIPGLNTKFAALDVQYKKLSMLGLLALVAAAVFGLTCTKYGVMLGIPLTCTETGAIELLKILGAAAIANQAAFQLTPQTMGVRIAKGDPDVV